jgi:hypothetical protein
MEWIRGSDIEDPGWERRERSRVYRGKRAVKRSVFRQLVMKSQRTEAVDGWLREADQELDRDVLCEVREVRRSKRSSRRSGDGARLWRKTTR